VLNGMPSFTQGEIKERRENNKKEDESQKMAVIIKHLGRGVKHSHLQSLSTRMYTVHEKNRPLPRIKHTHKKKEEKKDQNATRTNSKSQRTVVYKPNEPHDKKAIH
jgi:hypothetical protein